MLDSWIVSPGDTLSKIALKAYGDPSQWPKIVKANPQLSTRGKAIDGSPFIFPGDNLVVPQEPEAATETASAVEDTPPVVMDWEAEQDMALKINGKNFTGWTGWTLVLNAQGVDGFSFSSTWNEKNDEQKKAFKPFSFAKAEAAFKGGLIFKGRTMPAMPSVQPDAQTINVQGQPLCGALIDSCLPASLFPAEFSGLNLKKIAETVCEPFGVNVKVDGDIGADFEKAACEVGDKAWDFLAKLAKQRGLYLTNASDGSLLIYKPQAGGAAASFKQGEAPFVSCVPQFDGQKIYSHITGWTKTTEKDDSESKTFEFKPLSDKGVLRCYNKTIDDADGGSLENSVKALAADMLANCIKYTLTISGITDADGNLWQKNMAVSVEAPGAGIYKETKFIVDSVKLTRDDQNGERAEFTLVLPESRSGEIPEAFPWEE